jgi:ferredoxin-NADP reductase
VRDPAGTAIVGVLTILPDGTRMPLRQGETILAACRRYGYSFKVGCREGGCGECALELVSGSTVDARPIAESVLSAQDRENGVCLPCRAIPLGDTTIKLNRTDRLGRSPFADRLAARDLIKLALDDPGASADLAGDPILRTPPGAAPKVSGAPTSSGASAPAVGASTTFHEFETDLVVDRKDDIAEGVAALTLTDPSGKDLPDWSPGAHIDVVLDGDALTRQYSLCGSPGNRRSYRIAVLRDPHSSGGSQRIHNELQAGMTVRVRGPRNHFLLIDAPRYLFIAGGIGITPILPMIAAVDAAGADWRLLYGGRNKDSMAFLDELAPYSDRVGVYPQDEAGLIPLDDVLSQPRHGVLIYSCGPELLLDAVEGFTTKWPAGSLHAERFAARPVTAGPSALETFEVVCQRSGITLKVESDRSILEAAEEAGLKVLSSCRAGVCGTCDVDIIEGVPDHRDSVLSASDRASNEFMLVCISGSLSRRLVLDL